MILLSSTGENLFQLIVVLFCFVIVLALTYYVTRWIAGYQKSQSINKNLAVVETLKLTTNKYVQLIQAGKDTYYVIANTNSKILNGNEMVVGGSIIIPIDINTEDTTISITIKGI